MSELIFLIDVKKIFDPYYLRDYIKIPLRFVSSFEMQKWKMEFLDKYKKTLDTKRACILKHNCKYIYKKLSQYIIKIVNCVMDFFFHDWKIGWSISVPVPWCPKMWARVEKVDMLSWSLSFKV